MNEYKKRQNDSLAALRAETMGFTMVPFNGYDYFMEPDPTHERELAEHPVQPCEPRPALLSSWLKRRIRHWKRNWSTA